MRHEHGTRSSTLARTSEHGSDGSSKSKATDRTRRRPTWATRGWSVFVLQHCARQRCIMRATPSEQKPNIKWAACTQHAFDGSPLGDSHRGVSIGSCERNGRCLVHACLHPGCSWVDWQKHWSHMCTGHICAMSYHEWMVCPPATPTPRCKTLLAAKLRLGLLIYCKKTQNKRSPNVSQQCWNGVISQQDQSKAHKHTSN
jgi:hypothetical protein